MHPHRSHAPTRPPIRPPIRLAFLVRRARAVALIATLALARFGPAGAATPAELLAGYTAQAGAPAQPTRGRALFTTPQGHAWSCASCHGVRPVQAGQHAATGKPIAALAPPAQPTRFTDAAKAEKWFGRNCKDVLGRACTAAEKADVLAWLMSLKP